MRRLVWCLIALAGVVWLTPWALYEWGLSNITGRPIPAPTPLTDKDETLLRQVLRAQSRISVEPISPWHYLIASVRTGRESVSGGTLAAWLVARNYNRSHLKRHASIWWHLSGAALTIWLTRNWTSDAVLRTAAVLAAQDVHRREAKER